MGDGRVEFELNGTPVTVEAATGEHPTLLQALREQFGLYSVKDGCAPQGQCGCCTVWVDGQPRVACVTPVGRVAGRRVTTVEGLDTAGAWAARFTAHGASQCGFCTPGIVMRLAAMDRRDEHAVRQALLAHLCRCTGWQTIVEAATDEATDDETDDAANGQSAGHGRDRAATQRATIETRRAQVVGPQVALGQCGFAADTAPAGCSVAVRHGDDWIVAGDAAQARRAAPAVQGRRTTAPISWPIAPPDGDWAYTLQTTWVEPAHLEPNTSWCAPAGEPASSAANGGAFGAKKWSWIEAEARRLADEHGRPVIASLRREDVVRLGPKRPPIGLGIRADGTGSVVVARTAGVAQAIRAAAPDWDVAEADVVGPATHAAIRGAGWAEVAATRAAVLAQVSGDRDVSVTAPSGAHASARIEHGGDGDPTERVVVAVRCGRVLDAVVLRSFCIGAAHMALGMVRREGIAVDAGGEPLDLTIRSFGILRPTDTPHIDVELDLADDGEPVQGSDAVFAAVLGAAWRHAGFPPRWPTMRT